METLDIKTIAIIFFINSLVATLFMAAVWQQSRKQFPGIYLWLTSFSLLTAAFALVSLRNVIPDVASILIANTCLAAAIFLLYLGLERFVACSSSQRHNYIILAVFVGLFTYFTFFQPDVAIRIILLNITLVLMFLQSSWLMLHRVGSQLKPLSRATGIVCLMFAVVGCYRIILVFFMPAPIDYLNVNLWDAIGLLINQILTIGLVLVLILMVNRRMLLNILNKEELLVRSKAELEISNRDLSERKRIEATLRESEERYRDLVNFSKNGVAVYEAAADGEDFIFKDFNRAAENIDNVKKEDIIGKSVLQTFPGVKEFGLFEVFQRVWRTGVPEHHSIKQYRDKRISGWRDNYVYKLSSGEIVAIYEDVTERKQAEEALGESEERWQFALEGAGDGLWDWNVPTNQLYFSPRWKALLGYGENEIGNTLDEWDKRLHPDDYVRVYNDMGRYFEGVTPVFMIEYRLICKDGNYRWMLGRGKTITWTAEGQPLRVVGTQTDITEIKQAQEVLQESEEKFYRFFQFNPSLAAITDLQSGEVINVNQTFIESMGYTLEEVAGRTTRELNIWVDPEARDRMVADIIAGGKFRNIATQIRTMSGEIRTMNLSAERLTVGNRDLLFTQGLDITARLKAESELKESRDKIRNFAARLQLAREEERKEIALEIHDDLGQSLTALQIDLSWLTKRMPHDQKKLLEKAQSMLSMVKVADERVREIATRLRPPTLDDLGLVTAVRSYLSEFEQKTEIKCKFSSEPGEITLDADVAIALFRVLQGALINTAKHAGATDVEISLVEQTGGLYMEISDNGRGITEKELASWKSIGIIGMRERIAFFGGNLQIEGRPGKGTTVKVKIPVQGNMFE